MSLRRSRNFLNILSLVSILVLWSVVSHLPSTNALLMPPPEKVLVRFLEILRNGALIAHVTASLARVFIGFALAAAVAVPMGFLMGWYPLIRGLAEPVIQFFRTVPPIALIPLVILYVGIGEEAKIFVIWLASFLTMVISVYQGLKNLDATLVKAALVLGARDKDIFFDVAVPATFPYILVGMRLGLASAWSTLVAAELIAASKGLGYMITQGSLYFQVPDILLGIVMIGLIGIIMDRGILALERRLTSWQEKVIE